MRGSLLKLRSSRKEILDDPGIPEYVRELCYRDLAKMHRWLGNSGAIIERIRRDPLPVKRVLDIGCAHGALLQDIRQTLRVDVVGVDLAPPGTDGAIPIHRADAVRDELPEADVAVSLMVIHHFTADDVRRLICNVGRSCRRFIILDLVRHSVPFVLFRAFGARLVNPVNVEDGLRSIERAFTPKELADIIRESLNECGGTFRHSVAPFFIRQIVDIRYSEKTETPLSIRCVRGIARVPWYFATVVHAQARRVSTKTVSICS